MSRTYNITILAGDNKDVYKYIAPYAMNRKIVRQFDGYPIFTDNTYTWFLVFSGRKLAAWASLKVFKNGKVQFVNDFVEPDYRKQGIHAELIRKRIEWCRENGYKMIEVDCLNSAIGQYKKAGFEVVKTFVKWNKLRMILNEDIF